MEEGIVEYGSSNPHKTQMKGVPVYRERNVGYDRIS